MTVEEAITIINEMTPCANCEYRNTGCKRKDSHVWSDGFCHQVDEAIEVIINALNVEPEPDDGDDLEPEPYEPDDGNDDNNEPDNGDNEPNDGDNEPNDENNNESDNGNDNEPDDNYEESEPEGEPELYE